MNDGSERGSGGSRAARPKHVLWVLLAGIAGTGAVFWQARQEAWERLDADFRALAVERAAIIQSTMRRHLDDTEALRRFLERPREVTRQEFRSFAAPAAQYPTLQALEWIPRVPRELRRDYEEAARREGLPDFQFTERDAGGQLVRAGERAEYFPVYFVEPLTGNEPAAGFDLASEPVRRAALERARDSGKAAATAPVKLVQETAARSSLLLFLPVYEPGQARDTVAQRRAHLQGFAVGVLRAGDLVEASLDVARPAGVVIRLLDPGAPPGARLLHEHRPRLSSGNASDTSAAAPPHGLHWEGDFRFAARQYRVAVQPNDVFIQRHLRTTYRWVLPLGLLLTALLSLHLHALVSQRQRAEALVHQRTAELRANENRYRGVVEQCSDLVWRTDPEGRITFLNAAAQSLAGYAPAELIGQPATVFVAATSLAQVLASLQRRRQGELSAEPYVQEIVFRRKDGSEFIAESCSVPILDAGGRLAEIQGVARNITERKRAETVQASLYRISEAAQQTEDLGELYRAIHQIIACSIRADNFYIALYDPATDEVSFPYFVDERSGPSLSARKRGRGLTEYVLRTGRTLLATPEVFDQLAARGEITSIGPRCVDWLGTPLRIGADTIGVMALQSYTEQVRFSEPDISFLEFVSTQVAVAIERKRAEEALRESEERLQSVLEGSQLGLWDWDLQTGVVNRNERWAQMLGYTLAEMESHHDQWLGLIHPDDRTAAQQSIQDHLEGRTPLHEVEIRMQTKDGHYRWILDRARIVRRDANGRPLRMSGTHADITERKQAEEALRRSQADLERAQAVGHVGSWIADPGASGRLLWSAETCRIFGLREAGFDGQRETFFRLVHAEDAAAVRGASEAALQGKKPYDIEHRIVRPDGAIRWVHEQAEVERDAAGNPIRMVGVVQDITERRHLEERLRQSQKMEAVGQLAGGVAHDFNNILTATLMQLSLLQENPSLDAKTREALEELEKGARRAADLTRQLLLFSRRSIMQLKPLDLNELLADLQKMLRRLLGEHITFDVQGETALPRIRADAGMIQQVVVNLCVNARDAMPQGGGLSVRTAAVEISADQTKARADARPGCFVCLSVADTGCGMDEATLGRLFEPFFTTKEVGKGTGLGLATVHGIVHQHRGWIEVQSEVGRGTTFRVFLPVFSEPLAAPSATAPEKASGGHETILLVEDDLAVRKVIARVLRRWGYRVLEASNGVEAVTLWQQHGAAIDLLYTDLVMPGGLSGLELAERLRAEQPGLKVLISSGYSAELAQHGRIPVPNVIYVPKPCPPDDLSVALRSCLDRPPPEPLAEPEP